MARNVNVYHSNWQKTGQEVQVDQWVADYRIEWIDDQGQQHNWEGEITFPNDLALVPDWWLKRELLELIMRAARKKLNIDLEDTS